MNETKPNNVHYISMTFSIIVFAINVLDMGPKTLQPHRSLVAFFFFFPNLNLWLNSQQTITSKKKKITFFNALMIRFFNPLYLYISNSHSSNGVVLNTFWKILKSFRLPSLSLSLRIASLPKSFGNLPKSNQVDETNTL